MYETLNVFINLYNCLIQNTAHSHNVIITDSLSGMKVIENRNVTCSNKVCSCLVKCHVRCEIILTQMSGGLLKQEIVAQLKLAVPVVSSN